MSSEITYPWFFFYRIARLTVLIFLPTLFIILFFYRSSYKEGLVTQMTSQVQESLASTKQTLEISKMDWLSWCDQLTVKDEVRYSIVNNQGKILCDTLKDKKGETIPADEIHDGFSTHVKYSEVFNTQSVYGILRITPDLYVRKVVPINSLKDDLNRFDRVLFVRIIPFAVLSYFIFLVAFYRATSPLGSILAKVAKFQIEIPFNKNLQLLYKKNEWATIEEALNEADIQLKGQMLKTKAENEKIGAILESIHDDIIAIDSFETVLFYNTNFKRNFMLDRPTGQLMPKLWHKLSDETVLKAFREVLKTGHAVTLKSLHRISPLNPELFFDLTVTPLRNADGITSGALGVFYDVTEFKLTEQMRVDFVANVSHEIRTPLTSIKGYSQVLEGQKDKVDPSLHGFLSKIVSNTERMISLFNDLLNLSVIESKNIMKSEELDLPDMVSNISSNIMTNYPNKKIHITRDLQLNTIRGDHRLMEQVLSNLIDNACKYSGDDICIKVASYSKDNKAYIDVKDNGPGISKEHLQRIFERFYRVDTSREVSRGTGLGLSIVKHIITKHGGRIWAESEEASGTHFIIELPLV